MDYTETVFNVFKYGPYKLRKPKGKIKYVCLIPVLVLIEFFRHAVNLFLIITQIGFSCVYTLFITENTRFVSCQWKFCFVFHGDNYSFAYQVIESHGHFGGIYCVEVYWISQASLSTCSLRNPKVQRIFNPSLLKPLDGTLIMYTFFYGSKSSIVCRFYYDMFVVRFS